MRRPDVVQETIAVAVTMGDQPLQARSIAGSNAGTSSAAKPHCQASASRQIHRGVARAAGKFTAAHEAWCAAVGKAHGDTAGVQALIEVLLLHRRMPDDLVVAGLTAALRVGALTADAVALEARKAGDDHDRTTPADPTTPTNPRLEVASLTGGWLSCRRTPGPCRRSPPTTSCYPVAARPTKGTPTHELIHDAPPPRNDRTGRRRRRRPGLRMLRLPTARSHFEEMAGAATREQMSYRGFLAELLLAECDERLSRRSERRIKAAGFPRDKSLRAFDFAANTAIDPAVINTLATSEWVRKG